MQTKHIRRAFDDLGVITKAKPTGLTFYVPPGIIVAATTLRRIANAYGGSLSVVRDERGAVAGGSVRPSR